MTLSQNDNHYHFETDFEKNATQELLKSNSFSISHLRENVV